MASPQLPKQILPPNERAVDEDGLFTREWWLFFYNLSSLVLGEAGTVAAPASLFLANEVDTDATEADWAAVMARVTALQALMLESQVIPQALSPMLFEGPPQDPAPRAQPASVITVTASPFVYTAPFDGVVTTSGGTVSALALSRDGATFYATGFTSGAVPVSRLDQVKATYTVAPTMTFFPR